MDEPHANMMAIERMESLLYGLKALGQHLTRKETDHARLVTLILSNELEDLITICKAGDTSYSHGSAYESREGVYTLRLPLSVIPFDEESPTRRPKSDSGDGC